MDHSEYTEWELGYRRETTNEEYAEKYRAIYAQESTHETVYRPRPTDGQHPHITTMVPVKTSSGEVAAILCVQRPIREIDELRAPYRRNIVLTGAALSLLAAGFAMLYLKKQFAAPVRRKSAERSVSEFLNFTGNKCIYKSCNDCLQTFGTLDLTVLILVL